MRWFECQNCQNAIFLKKEPDPVRLTPGRLERGSRSQIATAIRATRCRGARAVERAGERRRSLRNVFWI
jgi:hypothetical protein